MIQFEIAHLLHQERLRAVEQRRANCYVEEEIAPSLFHQVEDYMANFVAWLKSYRTRAGEAHAIAYGARSRGGSECS